MFTNAIQVLRSARRHRRHWKTVWRGAKEYWRTGDTPDQAYQSLIALYCATNGRSNDFIHDLTRLRSRPVKLENQAGVLGNMSDREVKAAGDQIRKQGFVAFPARVPLSVVDGLTEFALSHEAAIAPKPKHGPERAIYDPKNPLGPAYWFDESTLMRSSIIQNLMCDHSIISIVQNYLQSLPILDIVGMWWSSAAIKDRSNQGLNGQLYHFDMNRVKWLKVMFYLTDVDSNGGPHCFIPGTHKINSQPDEILRRGYARISEEEIEEFYPGQSKTEITGPRGTLLIADTRGLHKGKTPETHDRLVFQLNYADSLFGAKFDRPEIPANCTQDLREMMQRYPRMYQRYRLGQADSAAPSRKVA